MATPFKDPRTGIYYFRRVVPAALRPFFNGASTEYKRTLDTRDPNEARQRYHPHAVIYEQKLAAARRTLATRLKIDQSFVRDVCSNRHSAAIVRGVITIGRSLGLDVIAEGIETEEQIACLREWRCASGQGYFYGRPIPASDFVQTWRAVDQYARVTVTRAASSTP